FLAGGVGRGGDRGFRGAAHGDRILVLRKALCHGPHSQRTGRHFRFQKDRGGACAPPLCFGSPGAQELSRSTNSPVRVSTLTRSPMWMWFGTLISRPVSSLAGLVTFCTVSPFTPGSVYSTVRVTLGGSSRDTTL